MGEGAVAWGRRERGRRRGLAGGGVRLPWRLANRSESERAKGWDRAYDARGVQRCQKRALGGPVSSASSTMAAAGACERGVPAWGLTGGYGELGKGRLLTGEL